jgi:hypothetical protein
MLFGEYTRIARLAANGRLPAIGVAREFAEPVTLYVIVRASGAGRRAGHGTSRRSLVGFEIDQASAYRQQDEQPSMTAAHDFGAKQRAAPSGAPASRGARRSSIAGRFRGRP